MSSSSPQLGEKRPPKSEVITARTKLLYSRIDFTIFQYYTKIYAFRFPVHDAMTRATVVGVARLHQNPDITPYKWARA